MVSYIVRMRFAAEDRENVSDILRQLALASRQEPGCVSFIPHTVEDDPSMVVIYEQYRDRAASELPPHHSSLQEVRRRRPFQLMREREVENLTAVV